MPSGIAIAHDGDERPVIRFAETWSLKFFTDRNEGVELSELPFPLEKM